MRILMPLGRFRCFSLVSGTPRTATHILHQRTSSLALAEASQKTNKTAAAASLRSAMVVVDPAGEATESVATEVRGAEGSIPARS